MPASLFLESSSSSKLSSLWLTSSPPSSPLSSSSPSLPPEAIKFLYSSLHRVDNLVRHYHSLRSDSNSQVNLLAHLSTRLSLLAHSNIAHTTRTIDQDHILCPPRILSLADRMSISLKDNIDRVMTELNSGLSEMELLYVNVDDILVALCDLASSLGQYSGELEKGVKHVQHVYFTLVAEVRARRDLWYRFTADEKRKSFMAASTLGDILMTPPVEWEKFAAEWVALAGNDETSVGDEVDDLAVAMGSWGNATNSNGGMMME